MGAQSSRIIWGRIGEEDSKLDVTLYDPTETIYVKTNMVIVKEQDPEDTWKMLTKLYICEVAEAAGEWDQHKEDWREVKSVYEYDSKKEYAIGARCIYNNYLWSCLLPISKELIKVYSQQGKSDVLVPHDGSAYWEHVKQTVGVAYHAVDHKEVYYDDGKNDVKWHKAMWFIPDEDWFDQEHEEEITAWNPDRQYEHVDTKETGDMVIYTFSLASSILKRLYECRVRHTTQGDREWHPEEWTWRQDVDVWDNHRAYSADEYVIHADTYVGDADIITFGQNSNVFTFKPGDKVVYKIDSSDKDSPDQRIQYEYNALPAEIRNKVENVGQIVNAVYVLREGITDPNMASFQRGEWSLTTEAFDLFLENDYLTDDEVIWSITSTDETSGSTFTGVLGVFKAKQDFTGIKPEETPSADPSKWETQVNHEQRSVPIDHLYRAKKDLTVGENLIWRPENWVIATQQIKPAGQDLGWYGWIWKKLGTAGADGYVYCFDFPSIGPYNITGAHYEGRMCRFIPEAIEGKLEARDSFNVYIDANRRVTGGGFTDLVNYLLGAFGIVKIHDIGQPVYCNFIYNYVQDAGWTKTELQHYYNFRNFTPLESNSFFSQDENNNYYKVTVIPGRTRSEVLLNLGLYNNLVTFHDSGFLSGCKGSSIPFIFNNRYGQIITESGVIYKRKFMNDQAEMQGEMLEVIAIPPQGENNARLYYFLAEANEIVGQDILSHYANDITRSDITVNDPTPELLAACVYWGLTYSNGEILNFPYLPYHINYYSYYNTSFKGDSIYRFYLAYASDGSYFIGYLIQTIGADTYTRFKLIDAVTGPYNLTIYGRFGTHYYGITEQSYYDSNSGIWDVDLVAKTLTKIITIDSDSDFKETHRIVNIPYVGGNNFKFEGNVVESLTLYFADSIYINHLPSRHSYYYDSTDHSLSVYIPMDDRNLFSMNTGLPTQATTYGGFFQDRISIGTKHYGIYVYVPKFNGYNDPVISHDIGAGAFFWMSYGYNDYINGPFFGGSGTDEVSF